MKTKRFVISLFFSLLAILALTGPPQAAAQVVAGDVIISGFQAWNTPSGQNPGEFVELFNTTNLPIPLDGMELISRVDNNSDGVLEVDWQLTADLTGLSIAPHSFFLIGENGVATAGGGPDLDNGGDWMDLATGEGGSSERAIGLELVIDTVHMDYVLYGRHDGSTPAGDIPAGDIPFGGFVSDTLIPAGSTWKYLDNGSDQGTAWYETSFDDSLWASGPAELGYGDSIPEATVVDSGPAGDFFITTYFRHTFNVTDAGSIGGLTLNLVRDDGAVVYLNGTEVRRDNLPAGTILYDTTASSAIGGGDESTFFSSAVDPALLVNGDNVIAVEIHQASGTSSDVSFDLELVATTNRPEVIRNTRGSGSFTEGLVRRETAEALYAGYDVPGYYTDEATLGDGFPTGVWASPHDETYGSYTARNSLSPAVLPPGVTYLISGDVDDGSPAFNPIEGVDVSADNGGGSDTTDAAGYYELSVPESWTGTVTPTKSGYTFLPEFLEFTSPVMGDEGDHNFEGTPPPAPTGWVAYNDLNTSTGDANAANVTTHDYTAVDGALVDYATGVALPVTVTGTTINGYDPNHPDNGGQTTAGDAYDAFSPGGSVIVDLVNTIELDEADWDNIITFDNLDPTKQYNITLTANRDNPDYAGQRFARVTIEGAESFVNASSTGVIVNSPDSVSFSIGYNTLNGYVAKWTGVTTGIDGSFSIKSEWDDSQAGTKGYAMTAFKLEDAGDIGPATCYALTLGHVGQGTDPVATPGNSVGCSTGDYIAGALIQLSGAAPDTGYQIDSWNGTNNDASTADTNTVTMPAASHNASVTYVEATTPPPSSGGVTEDFESGFTLGSTIGAHPDWYDQGSGPIVTAGIGVNGSVGLSDGPDIFTLTSNCLGGWQSEDFQGIQMQMDFQASPAGVFDDDRLCLMTQPGSVDSADCIGVQLDTSDGGIVTYWRDSADARIQTPIVSLTALTDTKADTWYRFSAVITKLTNLSAKIDVSLVELDASGTPTGTPFTGTVADTSLWPDGAPAESYFTTSTLCPAYKNHTGAGGGGAADNAGANYLSSVLFAAIGDFGDGSLDEEAVASVVNSFNPEFIVTGGDNSYGSNDIDDNVGQFYSNFIGNYTGSYGSGSSENRFFPALGNHDYTDGGGFPAYENYFTLPGAGIPSSNTSGSERYYDIVRGPVHVFVIDSNPAGTGVAPGDGRSATSAQGAWLQEQLGLSTAPWKIVVMHHPPYSSSTTHGSEVAMQWPYEQWGADAVFAGHDHVYERIIRDDDSDGVDFAYITTGAGGRSLYGFPTSGFVSGSQVRCGSGGSGGDVQNPVSNCYGATIIDATSTSLTIEYWSVQGGGTLVDRYTIGTPTGPTSETATFQEDVDGYVGTQDTFLQEAAPDNANGDELWFEWDSADPDGDELQQNLGLIRFDNIVGAIPAGSQIVSATLTYTVFNPGQDGDVREMLVDWDEGDSLNSLCSGECLEGTHYGAASIATAVADPVDTYSVDVTSSVQDWINGSINHGWIILPPDTFAAGGGVQVRSSEYGTAAERPKLTIRFNPAPPEGPPDIPTGLQVVAAGSSQIDLSWADGSSATNYAQEYEIEVSTDGGVTFAPLETVPATPTAYSHPGLVPETEYCYQVKAINIDGQSEFTPFQCTMTEAGLAMISFQEDVNGYDGTVDTHIMESEPGVDHGALDSLNWDTDDPSGQGLYNYVLIRFDNIFGSGPGLIPPTATIVSATLYYDVYDVGDPADVNEVTVDWDENETWNGFGGEAGVQADEYGNSVGTAPGDPTGTRSIDVTASIAAWAGGSPNRGWIFRPTGTNGVDTRSSEYGTASERPRLEITYRTSPAEPVVQLRFDEGTGDTAFDTAPDLGDNNGTLSDASVWSSDSERDSFVDLDGAGDNVEIVAAPLAMDTWSQFTVAARVRNDIGAGAGTDDIIGWWNYPSSRSWILTHHSNNQYFFEISGAASTNISGGTVSQAWTYVVGTYDGSTMRLYVNGSEVASAPHTGGIPSSTAPIIIGGQADGSNYFDGAIDDVEIFNEALSPQEIMDRYEGVQCLADLNGDGVVDADDTGLMALSFGETNCAGIGGCPADIDGNNVVDGLDLAAYNDAMSQPECGAAP